MSQPDQPHSTNEATTRFAPFTTIGDAEREALRPLFVRRFELAKGDYVHRQGDRGSGLYLLLEGWTASTIGFDTGVQLMVKVHMAGDMLGSPSLAMREAVDSIVALTPVKVAALSLPALGRLFESNPRMAALLFLISQEERVFLMDRLAAIAKTQIISAVASLLLQIYDRLRRNSPTAGPTFTIPLTQSDIADLVGATDVHTNRVVQSLRADGMIKWKGRDLTILDRAGLEHLSGLPHRQLTTDLSWLPSGR